MDFGSLADSAVATITSAAEGAGPGVVVVAAIIMGVGVVISLLKKAK